MTATYTISEDRQSITCLDCNMTSHYAPDVFFRYCGNCHEFHELKEMARRVRGHFDSPTAEAIVTQASEIARARKQECRDD